MTNYLFLQVVGTLITEIPQNWDSPMNAEAMKSFNLLVNELEAKIILLDTPGNWTYDEVLRKFIDSGFQYPGNIHGQIIHPESLKVKVMVIQPEGLKPFPIITGNFIKYWLENGADRPYTVLDEKRAKEYEIWELPEGETDETKMVFKGMRDQQLGKDYNYTIVGSDVQVLAEQAGKYIVINAQKGLDNDLSREIIMRSYGFTKNN